MPKGKVSVSKALELDESLAEAHTYLGHIRDFYDLDWAGAEREHKRAIELNPNDAIAHQFFAAYLIKMGRFNEAMAEQQRAHELDPLSFSIKAWGCWGYYQMRQYDRAVAECSETGNILEVWELKGMYDQFFQEAEHDRRWLGDPKVIAALKKAFETSGIKGVWRKEIELGKEMSKHGYYVRPFDKASTYAKLEEKDQAFACLETAYDQRCLMLSWVKVHPALDPLRSDPRFADLLRRVGLPP